MDIFKRIFRSRDKPTNSTTGSAYRFYMGGTTSGKKVTERSAMQMTAVYSCVRMGFGKMNGFADIVAVVNKKDSEGFSEKTEKVLASVRVYKEGRHGSKRWANLASFSEATDLFRFRRIPGINITTDMVLDTDDGRYEITSVEDVKSRGMYVEVLAKKVVPSVG